MTWYVIRRLLQAIPVLFGSTLIVYLLVFGLPGDPVVTMFGDRPIPDSTREAIERQYNLDKNIFHQWLLYIQGVFTGDLGISFRGREVSDILVSSFPVTIRLALLAMAFQAALGIIAGFYAGMRRGGIFDSTMLVVSLLVIAVPIFVLGFTLQFVFGLRLNWFSATVGGDDSWSRLILPAIALGLVSFAYVVRLTRTSVIENLTADHVKTARAKGLSDGQVNRRHILRNSMIPVVTFLGADLGTMMTGAIVTEGIFRVNGVGNQVFRAISTSDGPVIVGIVTVMVFVYVLTSLLVDLLYAALDPRIRYA